MKPRAPLEKYLQQQGSDFLALDGWRRVRTDMPQLRGLGVQEKGMADDLYLRYESNELVISPHQQPRPCADAEVLWIEWKRKGGKAGQHQKDWHQAERARGALVWVAGEDFEATFDAFKAHYQALGLMRKHLR